MKFQLLFPFASIVALSISSCCKCDEPTVYTISTEDLSILPANPTDNYIRFRRSTGGFASGRSAHTCDEQTFDQDRCGNSAGLACNCPDSKEAECDYEVAIEPSSHFDISFIKNDKGLHTKFILNGRPLKQVGTRAQYKLGNTTYYDVMVFESSDRIESNNNEVSGQTLYAPGKGLLQTLSTDGAILTLAE